MDTDNLKPLLTAIAAAFLMLTITLILPLFFKSWFVYESGNIRILEVLGPILAVLLLMRLRIRKISLALFGASLLTAAYMTAQAEEQFKAAWLLLVILHGILLWLLAGKDMRQYLREE